MPSRATRSILFAAALLLSAACSGFSEKQMRAMVPAGEDEYARGQLELLASGNAAAYVQNLDPQYRTPEAMDAVRGISGFFAGNRIERFELIGVNVRILNRVRHQNLSYQVYLSGGKLLAANVASRLEDGRHVAEGATVTPMATPLQVVNAFTLSGKPAASYVILVLGILVPLLSVYALVLVFRMPLRRRWPWVLFCVLSIGQLSLNWTTGDTIVNLFNVQLLGAGLVRASIYSPWIVQVAFPLGALWVISKYHRGAWRHAPAPPASAGPVHPQASGEAPVAEDEQMPVTDHVGAEETPAADEGDRRE